MRTKGIWPTAPRIALVMSFTTQLEDGRYMNVTKSVDSHPDFEPVKGDVRMIAKIAGLVCGKHPTNPKLTRCIQIVDGDLGGWLPASVVSMVTTQAFPVSMRRVNSQLKKIVGHRTVSNLIEASEGRGRGVVVTKAPLVKKDTVLVQILKRLREQQPWMVLAILLVVLFKRK